MYQLTGNTSQEQEQTHSVKIEKISVVLQHQLEPTKILEPGLIQAELLQLGLSGKPQWIWVP